MRRSLLFATIFILIGCKGNREKEAAGSWTSAKGMKITLTEDKSFTTTSGRITTVGTWSMTGDDVTFVETTINGKPVSQVKTGLENILNRLPAARRTVVEKILTDMGKPNVLALSADGKTLTTDKAKDTNVDPWSPLTKG